MRVVLAALALLAAAASAQPAGQPDSTQTDSTHFHRTGQVAAAVGRPSSLIGRFAYWCLADLYRNVAASTSDSRIASIAHRAADQYERAAPTPEQYTVVGFSRGQTVVASLGAYGTCSTVVR